jgi:hypothetical protein
MAVAADKAQPLYVLLQIHKPNLMQQCVGVYQSPRTTKTVEPTLRELFHTVVSRNS